MDISMDICMDIPMDIHEKICGYGCGYGWEISYPRQACYCVDSCTARHGTARLLLSISTLL